MTILDEKVFYKRVGEKIKRLRINSGLTQEKLAERAGISLDYMGKIEVSINRPGLKTILKLAKALSVAPCHLIDVDNM